MILANIDFFGGIGYVSKLIIFIVKFRVSTLKDRTNIINQYLDKYSLKTKIIIGIKTSNNIYIK